MADKSPQSPQLGLMRFVLGSDGFLPIDETTSETLRQAMDDIAEMVEVEQKLDILLANFQELEEELATRSLRHAFRSDHSHREFYDGKQVLNQRVMNTLTAARLYLDQAHHHVKVFFPDDPARWAELKDKASGQYDSVFGYRLMEALRNFAQHRGLPLQGMTLKQSWIEPEPGDRRLVTNLAINLITSGLSGDGGLKPAILAELEALGEVVDIKQFVRDYIEGICVLHDHFRAMVADRITSARELLAHWKARFARHSQEERPELGLHVGLRHPDGTATKLFSLHGDQLTYLEILRARTGGLGKISRRFVTTMPI
jgi:hypothetical protein